MFSIGNPLKRMATKVGMLALRYSKGRSFSARDLNWYFQHDYPQIYSILAGGMPAWSGETVSVQTALGHSVVWACNKIISESIGFIPAILMQVKSDNAKPANEHPMYSAMKMAPNEEITAQSFMELLTSHTVMTGNGYAQIVRRSSNDTALKLYPIMPQNVYPDHEKQGKKRLVYVIKAPGEADKTYTVMPGKAQDILHIRGLGWDGIQGYSVIAMARQSIGSAIAAERNIAHFWKRGGRKPYFLRLLKEFKTPEGFTQFRNDWEKLYDEPNRVPVMQDWLELKDMGMTMREAQMIEYRQFMIAEICRWFNISPHLVGDLSRATFSNIEELFMEFLQMTLATWINRWEQEFSRCVLTDAEKSAGYELRFNHRELLRGDFKSRMAGYASALQNGYMNIDEVRTLEGYNKLPDGAGSHHHIQLNLQAIDSSAKPSDDEDNKVAPPKDWLRRIA